MWVSPHQLPWWSISLSSNSNMANRCPRFIIFPPLKRQLPERAADSPSARLRPYFLSQDAQTRSQLNLVVEFLERWIPRLPVRYARPSSERENQRPRSSDSADLT